MSVIVPSARMNAIANGINVFFIQKQCTAFSLNTKSIPSFGARFVRYMRPCSRSASLAATAASITNMPAVSFACGNSLGCLAPGGICCACASFEPVAANDNAATGNAIANTKRATRERREIRTA